MGNPRYVVTSRPSDPVRHGYSLHYTKQNALWLVVKAEWEVQGGAVINERRSAAEEIPTEGVGIARTLTRRLAPPESDPDGQTSPLVWEFVREVQRDHDGDERTGEFAVGSQGDATPTAEYFGGLGRQFINATGGPVYDGHDQVGSAVLTTDAQSGSSSGARLSRRYYTAFGERVAELGEAGQPPPAWAATTFGYCGAFGYEGSAEWPTESNFGGASGGGSGGASGGGSGGSSGGGSGGSSSNDDFWESDLGVLHVGARWYWPETGRFLERDPIGILGALNTYVYSSESVLEQTDPSGLAPESIVRSHDWRFRDHREQDRSARRPVPTRYLGDPPPPPPQPPPSEVPALFPPTVWPFEFVEKGEATLILSSVGMCAAFIGDACMTVGGVPFWYDGEGGEFGYCTKRVGRTILRIWD